ncbi:NAD(P)-binding protein [Streptomyces sp. NPDC048290]|uniref:NAD(P)/FAD-dependent oxidoreductase n=1 Tax=Streptomyces sp. NPDC048290 TaxID=3155811 RepID=UPI0034157631
MAAARLLASRRPDRPAGRALVVGAGIAGLLAARVLADGYRRVEILERDTVAPGSGQRPGVPQGHHVHGLTARGALVMEELFPGLRAALTAAGAHGGDFGEIVAFRFPDGWSPRTATGIGLQTFSRPLLETLLRDRVADLPGVTITTGVQVTGLTGGPRRVTGVRTRGRGPLDPTPDSTADPTSDPTADPTADLVVDATGRTSRLPAWLAALGLPPVPETVVDARVGYASRLYAAPGPDTPPWAAAMELVQAPGARRGFMATRIEGDRLLVTLQGADGDHPPHTAEGFTAFAATLRTPLAELLDQLTPLSAPRPYAHCANRRLHYDRLPHWPDGLIALGDAVCAFNPLYGQGMGVAAMEAELLRAALRAGPGFAGAFQRRLAALTRRPWLMSTAQDRGWQQGPTPGNRATAAVLTTVQRAMAADPDVFGRFLAVMHMTRGPAALLHPRTLRTVAVTALRAGSGAAPDADLWWGTEGNTARVDRGDKP